MSRVDRASVPKGHMRVKVYANRNILACIAKGWSLRALAENRISTLDGRTLEVEVPRDATVKDLKRALEDKTSPLSWQEGLDAAEMSFVSTSNRSLEDSVALGTVVAAGADAPCALVLMTGAEQRRDARAASRPNSDGCAERARTQGSQTATIAREAAAGPVAGRGQAPQRGAGPAPGARGAEAGEEEARARPDGGATSVRPPVFQGVSHTLGTAGGGGVTHLEDARARALAAAEARARAAAECRAP